jgi:uncharacterized membrane protein
MTAWTTAAPPVLAAFLASAVEFVEALTIVLAVGVVRGWRSALLGTAAGVALLAGLVLAFGPALARVPLPLLLGVVGTLLLLFGLRWLRKAILRAAGVLALHDEDAAFAKEQAALRAQGTPWWRGIDVVAFLASFKAVVLEGLEVVFIVLAVGASGPLLAPAALGAALALLVVVALGLALRRPLARVPENALKFGVGAMLAGFGAFWVGEALGWAWPGADAAVVLLIAVFAGAALGLVVVARRAHRPSAASTTKAGARRGVLADAAGELWGLFVDDGWLAAGIVLVLAGAWRVARAGAAPAGGGALLVAALLVLLAGSVWRRARG